MIGNVGEGLLHARISSKAVKSNRKPFWKRVRIYTRNSGTLKSNRDFLTIETHASWGWIMNSPPCTEFALFLFLFQS
jgi:hypothetical protein